MTEPTPTPRDMVTRRAMNRITSEVSAELGVDIRPLNLGDLGAADAIYYASCRLVDNLNAITPRKQNALVITVDASGHVGALGWPPEHMPAILRAIAAHMEQHPETEVRNS